ncbi:MAG: hypothetical protein GX030_02945 [Firmicutes bacterium]|nr:hypothetical protein [Bacillota bacterium]
MMWFDGKLQELEQKLDKMIELLQRIVDLLEERTASTSTGTSTSFLGQLLSQLASGQGEIISISLPTGQEEREAKEENPD